MIKLSEEQILKFNSLVKEYLADTKLIGWDTDLDNEREKISEKINACILQFFNNELNLEGFKSEIDSINKRNELWGFRGMNGQMFFNMLYKNGKDKEELNNQLKEAMRIPDSIEEAKKKVIDFQSYVESLQLVAEDKRKAPNPKRILYFITYFWQIQNKDKFPTFYTSLKESFIELNFLQPNENLGEYYADFYSLNLELLSILRKTSDNKLNTLWHLEHIIWKYYNRGVTEEEPVKEIREITKTKEQTGVDLTWIPPVLSDLQEVARNDPKSIALYEKQGKSVSVVFENKVGKIFELLGYEIEELGQGKGNNPDGVAVAEEENYVIIYDTKAREEGYDIGTEDRKFKDYIEVQQTKYKGKNIFFLIICSEYVGNGATFKEKVKNILMSTKARDIIALPANLLLYLLELKLRFPADINTYSLHGFLIGKTGVISKEQIDNELRPR